MSNEQKLALIVWEHTREFQTLLKDVAKRVEKLEDLWAEKYNRGSWISCSDPRVNDDGEFIFHLVDKGFQIWADRLSIEEALEAALRYGDGGWWTLAEFEQFINGPGGPILEAAIWGYGFRPHKTKPGQWARKGKEDERKIFWGQALEWPDTPEKEWNRLKPFWVLPNEWAGADKTYGIRVNKQGRIYVCLVVNPFGAARTEDLGELSERLRNRGHLAIKQDGFYLQAKNIQFGGEKGIHILAIKPDESCVECVWPQRTPQPNIYPLAANLVSKVKEL